MRVLLVDDDTLGLDLRRMILERLGHEVSTAVDAVAARAGFSAHPDAVVLDLRMPTADVGMALLREAHAMAPTAFVVVLSGYAEDLEGRPERAFAHEVLDKPVRMERLIEVLVELWASRDTAC